MVALAAGYAGGFCVYIRIFGNRFVQNIYKFQDSLCSGRSCAIIPSRLSPTLRGSAVSDGWENMELCP